VHVKIKSLYTAGKQMGNGGNSSTHPYPQH